MDGAYIRYLQSSRQTLLAYREKFVEISAFVSDTVVETRQAWQFFWRTTYVYISVNCITTLIRLSTPIQISKTCSKLMPRMILADMWSS